MTHRAHFVFALLVAITISNSLVADEATKPGNQQPKHLKRQVIVELDYLLYLPPDYESQDAWPLVLFLHGAGERGNDLELVKTHGPPKLVGQGKQFPFILVSPQCPEGGRWSPVLLSHLLDEIVEKHKVDQDRIYVTGLSMGGAGTWALAAHSPGRFAAILPICGWGEPFRARQIAKLPTWIFHGADDRAVPLRASEEMVAALESQGGTPKFTVYPETGHDSWSETYANPEVYEWLLSHRRSEAPEDRK